MLTCLCNVDPLTTHFLYRQTLICQTCLSQKHHLCRSDRPFPNFSPIFYCISTLFVWNSLMTKTRLYRSDFSFPREVFHQFYHWLCRSQNVYRNRLTHTKTYFGHHCNLLIIALINFQCVFILDIAAVKHGAPHGAHGISANGGTFDIELKPVIGKLIVVNNQSALIDR